MTIPTVGKSTLLGFRYRLVGFAYMRHPMDKKKVQMTFFHQQSPDGLYLICMSDVTRSQAKQFQNTLRGQLGDIVDAEEVVPYVQRSVGGATFNQFKDAMREGLEVKAEWWNGHTAEAN